MPWKGIPLYFGWLAASLHIINEVIYVNSNVLCYGIIILVGKELFHKHGWRKGGQTLQ